MVERESSNWSHSHSFGTDVRTSGERRTRWVIALTCVMMVAEIGAGLVLGSMALLADGWHMASHAAALSVTAFAYYYARKHANSERYSFGTGKVSALGGFGSAVALAMVALLVLAESLQRLVVPVPIHFNAAILVAALGLVVNLVSAWMLHEGDGHDHGHDHHHAHTYDHGHAGIHRDHNLRAAYLHVLADALTSVLALAALITGKYLNWTWMDPMMGVVGSLVIARWSIGLLRDTSRVLLDGEAEAAQLDAIRELIEADGADRVVDLHLWRVGPRHLAAIVAVVSEQPRQPGYYKQLLSRRGDLAHITVEVNRVETVDGDASEADCQD